MAIITVTKEKGLSEDLDLGMGSGTGTRVGSQINATNIPYNDTRSIAEELDTKATDVANNDTYALKEGDTANVFNVADATIGTHAVNGDVLAQALTAYPLTTQVTAALAEKASLAGDAGQLFNAFTIPFDELGPFPASTEVPNFGYMSAWFNGIIAPDLDAKAEKSEVISKVTAPSTPYVPTLGSDPANKQYVDDKVVDIGAADMTQADFVNDGSASIAVYSTKNLGNFGHANGFADADLGVLKLSQFTMLDADLITALGIGIFIGVDILNSPPATPGIPVAVEQMDMDGTGVLLGQRCTTDQGLYTRFGVDQSGTFSWTVWTKAATETDIANYTYSKAESDASALVQDDAIALNTAKVGITVAQADAIVANTAKVGITTAQADAIVANTAKISYTDAALVAQHTTDIGTNATNLTNHEAVKSSATVFGHSQMSLSGTTLTIVTA